jgi:hypothetical protein
MVVLPPEAAIQVPIIIKAKDNVTPINDLEISKDNGDTWQAMPSSRLVNITVSGTGMKTYRVMVKDRAGNIAEDYVQLFVL